MTAVLSSCACKEMETNMANLAKIRVGMDKEQVLKIMGPPLQVRLTAATRFFIITPIRGGWTVSSHATNVLQFAFDDYGKVIGWGPAFNTGVYDTSRIR